MQKPTNPGLKKLPRGVRNKMGYMAGGGNVTEGTPETLSALKKAEMQQKEENNEIRRKQGAADVAQARMQRLDDEKQKKLGAKQKEQDRLNQLGSDNYEKNKAAGNAKGGSIKKMSYGGKVKKMAYGGKAMKMAEGKMVTKKKKTAKVARRRGDGICSRGKTKGRMV
jgi:hypothetical protein